jgi:hypothetical protein
LRVECINKSFDFKLFENWHAALVFKSFKFTRGK